MGRKVDENHDKIFKEVFLELSYLAPAYFLNSLLIFFGIGSSSDANFPISTLSRAGKTFFF